MADSTLKPSSGDDLILSNDDGSKKIEVPESGDVEVTGDFKTTTIKVNNLKDNTGTRTLASDSGSAWSWGAGAPSGSVLQVKTDVYAATSYVSIGDAGTQLGSNLEINITCSSTSNKLLVNMSLPGYWIKGSGRSLQAGLQYSTNSDFSSSSTLGTKPWPWGQRGQSDTANLYLNLDFFGVFDVPSTSTIYIRPYMASGGGASADVYIFQSVDSTNQVAYMSAQEIQA
tara:strand:- start:320 stop:1003 length:684 start_codon:yes stop_codon:yes gene_type:complete